MSRPLSVMALVIGFGSVWPVAALAQSSPAEPVVMVTGEGIVKVLPDLAWLVLATESRSKNPKDAQAQNAAAMSSVQQKLAGAGLAKDTIRTMNYDLQLESDWVNGRQVPRGYVARNLIEVRLDDITRIGEIIDLAVTSGANSVQGVRFDLKDRPAHEREALRRATADARRRAESAASGAGSTIGRILKIEEPSSRPFPQPMPVMMERMNVAAEQRPVTPINAGEIELRANVVLTATLK